VHLTGTIQKMHKFVENANNNSCSNDDSSDDNNSSNECEFQIVGRRELVHH